MTAQTASRILVDARVCAPACSLTVSGLKADRLGAKRIPFVRIGRLVRYDMDRVRAALLALEEGGPTSSREGTPHKN